MKLPYTQERIGLGVGRNVCITELIYYESSYVAAKYTTTYFKEYALKKEVNIARITLPALLFVTFLPSFLSHLVGNLVKSLCSVYTIYYTSFSTTIIIETLSFSSSASPHVIGDHQPHHQC